MAENLKVTHEADGASIPFVNDNLIWKNLSDSAKAFCWYNNDSLNKDVYGALYTLASAFECPSGWHLPSSGEWNELIDYVNVDITIRNVCILF